MADLIYLIEMEAYDPDLPGSTAFYFASGTGYMTRPSESPANLHFEPRLQQPISFARTMFSAARVTGGGTVGAGEIVLNNLDGGLHYLRDYGTDGRRVIVYVGEQGALLSTFSVFLTGVVEQVEIGATRVTIRLRDKLHALQQPMQTLLYGGTNSLPAGVDGVADDIKGQRKPVLYGHCRHIPPVLVNTARLIYQCNAGAVQSIDAVYDQGVALVFGVNRANTAAMEAAAPAAGAYDTCTSAGLIRLGAAPAGRVTMDVHGRGGASGSYVDTAAEIVEGILVDYGVIDPGDIDSAAVAALASAAPAECGWYFTGEVTLQQAVDTILASIGGWLLPDRFGIWQMGQLIAPPGSPDHEFTDVDILALDAIATRDAGAGVPIWQAKLRYAHYAANFGRADLAGAVTEADKARLLQAWREVAASDSSVQTAHLLATSIVRDTALQDATEAATEVARVLALHKVRRDYVRARIAVTQARAEIELGEEVRLTTARLGYDAGRDFIVVGIDIDAKRSRLTLDLWG